MRRLAIAVATLLISACGSSTGGPQEISALDAGPADGASSDLGVRSDVDSGSAADAAASYSDAGPSPDSGGEHPRDAGSRDAGSHDAGPGATARAIVADGGRLVDVREKNEYDTGHLPGALNLPLSTLSSHLGELEPKDQWVVVYCQSGGRSSQAALILTIGGFTRVFDLGAMSNW